MNYRRKLLANEAKPLKTSFLSRNSPLVFGTGQLPVKILIQGSRAIAK